MEFKQRLIKTYFRFSSNFWGRFPRNSNKVLVLAEFAPSGGAREYFKQLVVFLRAAGKEVLVLLPNHQVDTDIQNFLNSHSTEWKQIPNYPESITGAMRFGRRLNRAARKFQPAAIWISAATPGKWLAAGWTGIPVIYTLHTSPEIGLASYQQLLLQMRKSALNILTVSAFARAAIISRWRISSDLVTVIPNTVNVPDLTKSDDSRRVVTVGHLEKWKNPQFWLTVAEKVCEQVPDAEFVWIGEGSIALHSHKFSDRIKFIGARSNLEALQEISAASVYFQPSKQESFGMAVLEAMALGKPVVVSKMGGLPDLVENGETGFIVPISKPDQVVEQLVELLQDKSKAAEMGMRARQKFEGEFAPETWRARMQALLDRVIT